MTSSARGGLNRNRLRAFAARYCAEQEERVRLRVRPLHGGLQSAAVVRITAHFSGPAKKRPDVHFVAKCVTGQHRRETAVYNQLLAKTEYRLAPHLLGTEHLAADADCLYMEWIGSRCPWPWCDSKCAALVLEQMAHIHGSLPLAGYPAALAAWDYERDLLESARSTLELARTALRVEELAGSRGVLRAIERIVSALPAIRQQLLAADGPVILHGDAHSGNVVLRGEGESREAVLLDWGRLRYGSPWEDVSSWLQSLGYWEWEVRRRHDTLLRHYLAARGLPATLTRHIRDLYWLAGASNALAGALRYHLHCLTNTADTIERAAHARSACDWLRIMRRADACWHSQD